MSPVSFTVSSIQGMWFLTWRRVPQNPQLGSVPLIPIIICFRVLEDTLDSRHIALVPSLNHVWLFKTIACQAPLSSKISWSLLKFMSIGSMILSKMSSSVVPFSSCPPSFPASGSFPMSWLFASAGQGIGALAPVLPMNIQGWFCLGFTDLTPCSPRNSQESSPAPQFESINSLAFSLPYGPTLQSVRLLEKP